MENNLEMVYSMEKELSIIQIEKFYMKDILLMVLEKVMENFFGKMEHIIQDNLEMVYLMEKELNIIQMEKFTMKVIMQVETQKVKENIFGKMENIILANSKKI